MQLEIKETPLYQEAEALYTQLRRPGSGEISDAMELHVAPDGRYAMFAGTLMDKLEGSPSTRICRLDMETGEVRVMTLGPNIDRLPKYSPQGDHVAFLSDRRKAGDVQLHLLDPISGAVRATPPVGGWVEYLHWSPGGTKVLLGVAGRDADVSGAQGAAAKKTTDEIRPAWMPVIESNHETQGWRSAWIYDVVTDTVRRVSATNINIWEAVWCGDEHLAVVASAGPGEGLWYSARLHLITVQTGMSREIYAPGDQLGWPSATPSGRQLAFVEALCSDRWVVAGTLRLIDPSSGAVRSIDTLGIDITHTEWRSETDLLLAGVRGLETVVALLDTHSDVVREVWASREISAPGINVAVCGIAEPGDCALLADGFLRSPEVGAIRGGEYRTVKSLVRHVDQARYIRSVECVQWRAPDGLDIEGLLVRPHSKGPHPLVMNVHGGPVWNWRARWLGRGGVPMLMLLQRGFALFFPNPRGSSGRGRAFAGKVLGDLGGADAQDCLSGIDHLVAHGIADPKRLGVMGVSYGGFMACWLVTQDRRFAAAVALSPMTHHVSHRLISNIPHFARLFVGENYADPHGGYFERSPLMHAAKVVTPVLNVCGALDRCTPPEEAVQFHRALSENGAESVLLTYPQEGHGVRKFPASIDCAARVVGWFERHVTGRPVSD